LSEYGNEHLYLRRHNEVLRGKGGGGVLKKGGLGGCLVSTKGAKEVVPFLRWTDLFWSRVKKTREKKKKANPYGYIIAGEHLEEKKRPALLVAKREGDSGERKNTKQVGQKEG